MPLVKNGPGGIGDDHLDGPQMEILVNSAGGDLCRMPVDMLMSIAVKELKTQLGEMKMQLGGGSVGEFDKDTKTQVVINPGQGVKWQFLVDVYQAALEAGFTKVGFSTTIIRPVGRTLLRADSPYWLRHHGTQ